MMIHSGPLADLRLSSVEGSIAIVESIPAIAMDIEMTLRAHGAREILVIGTLEQANHLLDRVKPAAAIIDTHFAGSSAVVLASTLAGAGVPIVFLSADATFTQADTLARVTVLPKPHDEHELVETLANVLGLP